MCSIYRIIEFCKIPSPEQRDLAKLNTADAISVTTSHLHNDLKGKCTNFHVHSSIHDDPYVNGAICKPSQPKRT